MKRDNLENDAARPDAPENNGEHMFPCGAGQAADGHPENRSCRFSDDVLSSELDAAEKFLSGYRFGCRMLECARYERRFRRDAPLPDEDFPDGGDGGSDCFDETVIRAGMFRVRCFINTLRGADTNARMLLYWHYIRGEPVVRCAAMLGVSRASAFRIRRRGLEAAARALRTQDAGQRRM